MIFLGSTKLDKTKRLTLIKEAAEVLQADEKDHIMFYIDNGEIVVRKNLPLSGDKMATRDNEFWEWARRREAEINLMEDLKEREFCIEDLNEKKEIMKDYEESRLKLLSK